MSKYYGDEEKPSLESLFLEHHGVMGMKWGQHKQKQLDYHNKIASGQGSRLANLNYKVNVATIPELIKHNGDIKKIAANRAAKLQAQKDRIESGNATTRDKLDRALNTPIHHLVRGK